VTRSHTLKFRPIHHQQLSLKPRYSAQLFQALRSHRKNLRRGPLGAKSGKEEIQDNLIAPSPCSRVGVAIQILRERNLPFSQLVLSLNVSRSGPEALLASQILWTQTPPGCCSAVGWTVLKGFLR